MKQKAIFFDLDGTLTDSGEGIINCATLALQHYGLPVPNREEMRIFVGPPLRETLVQFGVPAEKTDEAVAIFRKRYTSIGKFENHPYPGISEMLQCLTRQGCRLFVATSKPEDMAVEILEKFELAQYFEKICGATLDTSRDSKEAVIAYLLEQTHNLEEPIMVGDTVFDVMGAAFHKIPTIGAAWGYGNVSEMEKAGAIAIARDPAHLLCLLENSGNL